MDEAKRLALIVEAVRYCKRVSAMGMPPASYTKALREPVHFLWERRHGSKDRVPSYRSKASLKHRRGAGDLVYEHAVPFNLLQKELLALATVNPRTVKAVLRRFDTVVLITKAEDALLAKARLARKMPANWNRDPLARYKALGITLVRNPLSRGAG